MRVAPQKRKKKRKKLPSYFLGLLMFEWYYSAVRSCPSSTPSRSRPYLPWSTFEHRNLNFEQNFWTFENCVYSKSGACRKIGHANYSDSIGARSAERFSSISQSHRRLFIWKWRKSFSDSGLRPKIVSCIPTLLRSSLRFESGNGGNGNVLPRSDGFSSFYLAQTARTRRVANVSHYHTDEIRIRPIAFLLMYLSPLSRSFFSFLRKSWTSVPPSRRGFTVDDFPLFSTLSLVMS